MNAEILFQLAGHPVPWFITENAVVNKEVLPVYRRQFN
jgi:hypothetical protein